MYYYAYLDHIIESKEPIKPLEEYSVNPEDLKVGHSILAFRGKMTKSKCFTAYDPFFSESLTHESLQRYQLENKDGNIYTSAINLNWLEANGTDESQILSILDGLLSPRPHKYKVSLMGLGDVGATVALGLKLLGGDVISELCLWDLNSNQAERQAIELNQILVNPELKVKAIDQDALFDGHVFVFCASKYVPKVGEEVADVRMVQLSQNAPLVADYMERARSKSFKGLFCIVSDPVDLLCKAALEANMTENDLYHLMPEQIRGYGLGVMYARAKYYGGEAFSQGRAFGPHGKDLVIANAIEGYQHESSMALTEQVVTANLAVRALGFKPYIAPAISSGAYSIVNTLRGDWHESAVFLGGHYWGCRNRLRDYGTEIEPLKVPPKLFERMSYAYERLETLWQNYKSELLK